MSRQSVATKHPEDRAIVHTTAAILLQREGRRSEAEAEYLGALRAWEETGRSQSADAAVILYQLGVLYVEEQRLDEARRVLERALIINERANDSVLVDRIQFVELRGVLHARCDRREARPIEARRVALRANRSSSAVVDLTKLLAGKTAKKGSFYLRSTRSSPAQPGAPLAGLPNL